MAMNNAIQFDTFTSVIHLTIAAPSCYRENFCRHLSSLTVLFIDVDGQQLAIDLGLLELPDHSTIPEMKVPLHSITLGT